MSAAHLKIPRFVAAAALCAMLYAQAATPSLTRLIDSVVKNGPNSELPAHLSMVLGVGSAEKPTAVKQAMVRDGVTVHTFTVCAGNHEDVVLLAYNEQSRIMKAYLVSAQGSLRKAVSYVAGGAPSERTQKDARGDFAAELKIWTDLAHSPAPHP